MNRGSHVEMVGLRRVVFVYLHCFELYLHTKDCERLPFLNGKWLVNWLYFLTVFLIIPNVTIGYIGIRVVKIMHNGKYYDKKLSHVTETG